MEFRSPRARQLWDKWRYVWMLAWERQRRLHEHLMYLHDLERVRQFSWDDWRKRVSCRRSAAHDRIHEIHFQIFSSLSRDRTVLEVHESQEITFDRSVPQDGQGQ